MQLLSRIKALLRSFWGNVTTDVQSEHFTGLLEDPRSQEEKDRDYKHDELKTIGAVDPFGNQKITQSPYPIEDQQSTNSCVPHGVGLAFSILRSQVLPPYTRLGWLYVYRLRSTYPRNGCFVSDVFQLYKNEGAPLYASAPDVATDAQANAMVITDQMKNEAAIFKGLEYYMFTTPNDIESLANLAETGTGIAISIYATPSEWSTDYPFLVDATMTPSDYRATINHEVCILPRSGFTENGKRYLTIQDSAHFGGKVLRHLSEDFISKRVTTAGYWKKVNLLSSGPRPKFTFTRMLAVGSQGPDVKALQQLLISEGLLPTDCVTGYFGGRTLAGVRAFQVKYAVDILAPLNLTDPTELFGSQSIKKANQLCA